jgi:hypothetical protein
MFFDCPDLPTSTQESEIELSEKNKQLLSILDRLSNSGDDQSGQWWDEYFQDMNNNRFGI